MNDITQIKHRRSQIKGQLTRFNNFLRAMDENPDIVQLENRLLKSEKLLDEFNDIQIQIEFALQGGEAETLDQEAIEREMFENSYYESISKASRLIKVYTPKPIQEATSISSINNGHLSGVKLPTLNLPTFNGHYDRWLEFYDTFSSLIHTNRVISDVQKFYYLRSCLKDEAALVIDALKVSSANYEIAWQLLCERFENKRLIIHNHIKGLFELKSITTPTLLRQILDTVLRHMRSLSALGQQTEHWDILIIHLITTKIDPITLREWESTEFKGELPTLAEITEFLRKKCELLETLHINKLGNLPHLENLNIKGSKRYESNHPTSSVFVASTTSACPFCQLNHTIYQCTSFSNLSPNERLLAVKKQTLCINCLHPKHTVKDCRSSYSCKKCRKRHNTLLHFDTESSDRNKPLQEQCDTEPIPSTSQVLSAITPVPVSKKATATGSDSQVLLSTVMLYVRDSQGNMVECRALLDSGAQSNFVTEEMCNALNLQKRRIDQTIAGINQIFSKISYKTEVHLHSRHNSFEASILCLVLPDITAALPSTSFDTSKLNLPQNIKLADPSYNKTGKINLLLGAGIFWDLLCVGQIKLGKNQPTLQKTKLGWILGGSLNIPHTRTMINNAYCSIDINNQIDTQLSKFWEIEEVPALSHLSREEQECEEEFVNTTTRAPDGRFIVSIPLRKNKNCLGESRDMALKRLFSIERKLARNPKLRAEYTGFLTEYEELGHMTRILETRSGSRPCYYLPHHAVINESSTTTKVRVVFDGSAQTSSNISLNDVQKVGPQVQNDIFSIILRFRKHSYVVTADIAKMYRQVLVQQEQRCLQRILWRTNPSQDINCYELNTITYGTASSSFLATRCLRQLALDFAQTHPTESSIIQNDFYVDDLLSGADSIPRLIEICKNLDDILRSAGFVLRKWVSNEPTVIDSAMGVSSDDVLKDIPFCKDAEMKTLGVFWNSYNDTLQYKVKDINYRYVTKRTILSVTAQIYDPLGLLGPIIIRAKLILQQLWQCKLSWDESIPLDLHTTWSKFRSELPAINEIKIPRQFPCKKVVSMELHGFCDASESAYGACIYLRCIDEFKVISTILACAKSRVAPLRTVTLPRLELCAALLLAKFAKKVRDALQVNIIRTYYWGDSTIVLSWLRRPANQWTTFVANRVASIQNSTSENDWHHVRTHENPADLLSRGICPDKLKTSNLWWHGPSWLSNHESEWPESGFPVESELPEARKVSSIFVTSETGTFLTIFSRYSSFSTLVRVVSYLRRFTHNGKCDQPNRLAGPLTVAELHQATTALIKNAQMHEFNQEHKDLQRSSTLKSSSKLLSLNPFIDKQGLIRVEGRIQRAGFNYKKQHPILLPARHPITQLIVLTEHLRLLHCGPQALLASLRERYWPLSGRNIARKIVHNCVICFKTNPRYTNPIMGALPKERILPAPPFLNCGVDYAGPFLIKDKKSRGCKTVKCYVCLFVCFATKAVHLELVGDLTTDLFLAAFKRFVSRRGKPQNVYSDNGSNFIGAKTELAKFLNSNSHNARVNSFCNSDGITWKFIPPRSPHFGGLWEAGVKSTKAHLKRVIGNASLIYEEFSTVLIQIESDGHKGKSIVQISKGAKINAALLEPLVQGIHIRTATANKMENTPAGFIESWNHGGCTRGASSSTKMAARTHPASSSRL